MHVLIVVTSAVLRCTQVPWFAAAVFVTSGTAAGMGTWLLFLYADASLHTLAANLPMVVSVLWAAAHCATASMDLWFAVGLRRSALRAIANVNEVGPLSSLTVVCSAAAAAAMTR
jgi:hypothetical protein